MNRQIRQLAAGLIVLYVILFVALNYWQVSRTEELAAEPENTRAVLREFDKPRGPIITADGVVVARSVQAPGDSDVSFVRQYPTGDLFADVTGYYTFGLGKSQLEQTRNDVLTGDTTSAVGGLASATGDVTTRARFASPCDTTCRKSPSSYSAPQRDRSCCSTSRPARSRRCGASRRTTRTSSQTPTTTRRSNT